MAFTVTKQEDNLRLGNKYMTLVKGNAGASGNVLTVSHTVDHIIGLPNGGAFSQSGAAVTVTGLTNTNFYDLMLLGASAA